MRALIVALLAGAAVLTPLLPTGMYVWDAPQPIAFPLAVQATGGATTQISVRDDGDVASINVRAPRRCYTVRVADANGQQITIGDRSACGRMLWFPLIRATKGVY